MSKFRSIKKLLLGLTIVILFMMALGTAWLSGQIQQRKQELAEALLTNSNAAVVAYTIDAQGEPVEDGKAIFYHADTPLVLASTMKVAVLAAYESAVVNGELDPNEPVQMAELERYYLPVTDGSAHKSGLASLGIKTDALGFALDGEKTLTLDDIARLMIHYSGNAEMDYLVARLGKEKPNSTPGLENHVPIRSILGISLAMLNHESTLADPALRQKVIQEVAAGDTGYLDKLVALYLNDETWRSKQIEFVQSNQYIEAANQLGWDGQVEAARLFPTGTAREYARLMADIYGGQMVSAEVSARMQQKLESMPLDWIQRLLYYRRVGDKDGLTAGVMNLVTYAVPKSGPVKGQARVVVIFANELSYPTWSSQLAYQGIYWLTSDLARAKGVFSRW